MKICSFQAVCMTKGGAGRDGDGEVFYGSVTLCHLQKVEGGRGHPVQAAGSWQHGSSMVGFPPQPCRVLFLQELRQNLLK